jgi:hypothetical protein
VKIAYAGGLGTYDVLLADRVLFTGEAIDRLTAPKGSSPENVTEAATEAVEETPRETAPKKAPAKKAPTNAKAVTE